MFRKMLATVAVAGAMLTTQAHAAAITTLSFSGTLQSGYDGASLFRASPGPLTGNYSATISYDPSSLAACSSVFSCTWNLTAANSVVETVTINSVTRTFSGLSGQLQFNTGGGNSQQIILSPSGAGFSFYGTFQDGSNFFGSPADVRNPQLNFSNVPLVSASAGGSVGATSFGFNVTSLSATTTTTAVPEPASLALLGTGLFGLGLLRRRWKN